MFDLTDKRALVTGASRGIGAATARLCAHQGWAVAVNYARAAGAAQAGGDGIVAAGGRAIAVQADVADEAQVLAMFARIDAELPRLAGLVNNAGVIDVAAEKARLEKAAQAAEKEAGSLAGRLGNPSFVEKAKPEAVTKAKEDHAAKSAEAERLRAALARLG